MTERRNEDRMRFRYGKCLNEKCEKCKSKETIEVPSRKEFVCPDCGSKLFECAPPKKVNKTPVIAASVVILVAIGIGLWFMIGSSDNKQKSDDIADTEMIVTQNDTIAIDAVAEVVDKTKPKHESETAPSQRVEEKNVPPAPAVKSTTREHKLSYGVWKGGWKNGHPHDTHGTMKYTQSHLIDSRDPKQRVAEPGDYVIGEWADGRLVQGVWYDSSNTVKGSILIGQ